MCVLFRRYLQCDRKTHIHTRTHSQAASTATNERSVNLLTATSKFELPLALKYYSLLLKPYNRIRLILYNFSCRCVYVCMWVSRCSCSTFAFQLDEALSRCPFPKCPLNMCVCVCVFRCTVLGSKACANTKKNRTKTRTFQWVQCGNQIATAECIQQRDRRTENKQTRSLHLRFPVSFCITLYNLLHCIIPILMLTSLF